MLAAGTISAGGSGTVDVMGTGGATTGVNSFGVQVQAANSMITSSGGNVHVEGHGGGTGNSTSSIGVHISTTAKITAGNLGDVEASVMPHHQWKRSLSLTLPPLGAVILKPV